MRKALILALLMAGIPSAGAEGPATTTVIPNSTTVTVVPNSTTITVVPNSTTVTLPQGVTLPPGAVITPPPGLGAPGTVAASPGSTTAPAPTTSGKVEFSADQLGSLTSEQRAAAEAAIAKAQASAPTTESGPKIPAEIAGLSGDLLSRLTPEQLKLVEKAKETGAIPSELKELLANVQDIPGDIYEKLSAEQKSVIEKARESGILDKSVLADILDGLTPAEIKAFSSGKTIATAVIQKAVEKRSITCTNGKKTIKLAAKSCPKGYKKK